MDDKNYQTLIVHGEEYKTLYTQKYANRKKWEKPNEKQFFSFIPGTIKKLMIKDQSVVKKGEPLFIIEAMKMENTIYALFDGKIKKIAVKTGDRVPKGQLILEFE
jgi:biotin carboxyl carrier protein